MPTFIIDEDQTNNSAITPTYTLTEGAAIWIFQEGVAVTNNSISTGTAISGGGFDDSTVTIEGTVNAKSYLLEGFGSNVNIKVTSSAVLGGTNAGIIDLWHGSDNVLDNEGIINSSQILMGEDATVFNDGTINGLVSGPINIINGTGAELLSNNGTINGHVGDFRTIINDGTIFGRASGSLVDTLLVNNGTITGDVDFFHGNDTYNGSGGGLVGGSVDGSRGDDSLFGSGQDDFFRGNGDDDLLNGGFGNDTLSGGAGNDDVNGGGGNDVMDGDAGDDMMSGGGGDDTIEGSAGEDRISGNGGDDQIIGGADDDFLLGNSGNDSIAGNGGDDRINGGNGDDMLSGGAGNDNVLGGAGDDTITSDGGMDTLSGEEGTDFVRGGGGDDLFVFSVGSDIDILLDFADDRDTISLTDFEFESVNEALSFAQQVGDDVVFDFGAGDVLTVENSNVLALEDDILI